MSQNTFFLEPIPPFRLDLTAWTLRRRPHNAMDRWDGTTYRRVLTCRRAGGGGGRPDGTARDAATSRRGAGQPIGRDAEAAVTAALERLLGLRIDLAEFYRLASRDADLGPLAQRFRGMKPPRFATVFEGVINAIACQQLTLTLGIHLLNRLAEATAPSSPREMRPSTPSRARRIWPGWTRQPCGSWVSAGRRAAP